MLAIIVAVAGFVLYLLFQQHNKKNNKKTSLKEEMQQNAKNFRIMMNGMTEAEYLEYFKVKIMGMDKTNVKSSQ